jgi:hypothetical protein
MVPVRERICSSDPFAAVHSTKRPVNLPDGARRTRTQLVSARSEDSHVPVPKSAVDPCAPVVRTCVTPRRDPCPNDRVSYGRSAV